MSLYKKTLSYFRELSLIPRRSHEEKRVRKWLTAWARENGWDYKADEAGNLLIIAPGKKEGKLCLQWHMDMVCVAQESHDWSEEGVVLVEKEGILSGDKTTLWADNGIGVAAMMALAETKDRPTLELLFTMGEEVGLVGAHGLELPISSDYGINLDWCNSSSIGIGCGGTLLIVARYEAQTLKRKGKTIRLRVSGLEWGHSGIEIHEQRGNAIMELAKIVSERDDIIGITDIKGGDADNAIPRSARAIALFDGDLTDLEKWLKKRERALQRKFHNEDVSISVKYVDDEYTAHYAKDIIKTIASVGSGVQKSTKDKTPLSSWNMGKLRLKEGKLKWTYFLRTNIVGGIQPMKSKIVQKFSAFPQTKTNTITYELDHETPVWFADPKNEFIQSIASAMSGDTTPKVPTVVTHATVEVGILSGKYPGTQWISIGATCHHMHTTREHISLADLEEILRTVGEDYAVNVIEVMGIVP